MEKNKDRNLTERDRTVRRLRRYKSVRAQLLIDRGGADCCSQAEILLAENASALAMWLEQRVREMVEDKQVDLSQINSAMNTLRRLLETLGIQRKPRT
jgi:hypothetical protein